MSDGSKLLQTLVNTENVEKRLAQSSVQGFTGQGSTVSVGGIKSERTDNASNDLGRNAALLPRKAGVATDPEDSDEGASRRKHPVTAQQHQQDQFEIDESRKILQKRRRPMQ